MNERMNGWVDEWMGERGGPRRSSRPATHPSIHSSIHPRLALVLLLSMALGACERDHVEITVEPRADGSFLRSLHLWHTDSQKKGQILAPPTALVDQAKAQYPKRLDTPDASVAFQGEFRVVPPDVRRGDETNRGVYTVWPSRLGHVGYYRERRPGRTDHFTRFREAADAADLLVTLAATMARQQLKGEAGLDKLAELLEGPFRKDFKEALFFVAHADLGAAAQFGSQDAEKLLVGASAYLVQFAEERGYLEAADLPRLLTRDGALGVATALVAKKMGRPLDAPLRKRLLGLLEPDTAKAAYQAALAEMKLTEKQFDDALKPLTEGLLHLQLFATAPELRYTLVLPPGADALHTSGIKDEKENRLHWRDELDDRPVASLYFALWAAPDSEWQTARLGRVALRGKELLDYVLWENGLRPELAAAWRAALDRLDPKGDLAAQLTAIRLGPPAKDGQPEEGARLLLDALKPKKP
ncbi:MAG: hypothetical protein FJ290_17190 [Planctomycetes bacterium]|nr:hypothetical protein [Planctomycetota bacterium]